MASLAGAITANGLLSNHLRPVSRGVCQVRRTVPPTRRPRGLTEYDHFLALCFGQLTYRESLRRYCPLPEDQGTLTLSPGFSWPPLAHQSGVCQPPSRLALISGSGPGPDAPSDSSVSGSNAWSGENSSGPGARFARTTAARGVSGADQRIGGDCPNRLVPKIGGFLYVIY